MHTVKQLEGESVTSDSYTDAFDLYRCTGFSYQVKVSAKSSPVGGYLLLQASNDGVHWTDVIGSQLNIANDVNTDVCVLEDANVTYRYARLRLHVDTGSYSADVVFNAQEGVYG